MVSNVLLERLQRKNKGAVMIVPITQDAEFILIREYAVGIERYELTFPKGSIDEGESPIEAQTESCKKKWVMGLTIFVSLKSLATSPAYMGSELTVVVAQDLYPNKLVGDEPESLEVVKWSIPRLCYTSPGK